MNFLMAWQKNLRIVTNLHWTELVLKELGSKDI